MQWLPYLGYVGMGVMIIAIVRVSWRLAALAGVLAATPHVYAYLFLS